MAKYNKNRGMSILGIIVFGVVVILLLSYFRISLKSVVESPAGQENINYVGGGIKSLWTNYLKEPTEKFWNFFVTKIDQAREKETNSISSPELPN